MSAEKNNEDIQSILDELRDVLSDLTKEEKAHAEHKIEQKLEELKTEPKVAPEPPEQKVQALKPPRLKRPGKKSR